MRLAQKFSKTCGLFLAVFSFFGASAHADDTPKETDSTPERKEQSKERFFRGVQLMKSEAWDAALVEFQASLALNVTRNGYKNAANCLKQLGRFDEAIEYFKQYIAFAGAALSSTELEQAQAQLRELRALTGLVSIESNVSGATVLIDGRERGKTPITEQLVVSQGTRLIRVLKTGYLPFERTVRVLGQQSETVDAKLEAIARAGKLQITEDSGKKLDVYIDGLLVGQTPFDGVVAPGEHVVFLRGPDRVGTQPVSTTIKFDETTQLKLNAEPLLSDLRIEPVPVGARLILDGVRLGQGVWSGYVRAGVHKIDVSSDGYFGTTKSIDCKANMPCVLKVPLDRDDTSSFWAKGRFRRLHIDAVGGVAFGASLGGEYEGSCSNGSTECYERKRPMGFFAGLRASYSFTPRIAAEVTAGFASVSMSVSRKHSYPIDQGTFARVDSKDDLRFYGPVIMVGASFAAILRPLHLSLALDVGTMVAYVKNSRSGTVATDLLPASPMVPSPAAFDPVTKAIPLIAPEIRLLLPVVEAFQVGLSLGAWIGIGTDIRPDRSPRQASTGQLNGKTIGFIPNNSQQQETAIGVFGLFQSSLFARFSF